LASWKVSWSPTINNSNALSKQITGDVVAWLKSEFDAYDEDGEDSFYEDYKFRDVEINLEFTVFSGKTDSGEPFFVNSAVRAANSDFPLLDIDMTYDARYPIVNSLEDIYYKLLEDFRHELEHISTQMPGGEAISRGEYYIEKGEVAPMVRGLHLKAKKMNIPTVDIFRRELEPYVKTGEISQEEYVIILDTWTNELNRIQGKK